MTDKLTCKMSDGTEWVVTFCPVDSGCHENGCYVWARCAFLMPIVKVDVEPNQCDKEREPKEQIDLTKLTEVKTFDAKVGSGVDAAIGALARMAAEQRVVAKIQVNGEVLTAFPWLSEEQNIEACKDHYWRCAKEPKREPREGWVILLDCQNLHPSKEEAEKVSSKLGNHICEIIKVREVI